jgi:hypothetical protein
MEVIMKKLILLLAVILPLASIHAQGGWGHNAGNGNPGHPGNGSGSGSWNNTPTVGMPQARFEQVRRDIAMRRFDNGKLMVAKQAAMNNRMSARQVRSIMEMFNFENSRLEFAKFAYAYVADPGRYSVVYGALGYPSSVAVLEQYINGSTIVYTGGAGGAWGGDDDGHGHGHTCNSTCGHAPPAPVIMPMAHCDFSRLLLSIQGLTFESTKEEVAMGSLRSNYFTADQIRSLMLAFTFESTKLDFAKAAYNNCVDPQNYYVVNDAFTFESSVCDLTRYIGGR